MNQNERRIFLIQELLNERENENYGTMSIPREREDQKLLLRGLMNVRVPKKINPRFLQIQDEYLRTETEAKLNPCKCMNTVVNTSMIWHITASHSAICRIYNCITMKGCNVSLPQVNSWLDRL